MILYSSIFGHSIIPHMHHIWKHTVESEPPLTFVRFRTTCWQTLQHHLNPHLGFWRRNNFMQSCRICLCSHRSSKRGLNVHNRIQKNEMIWKKQVVTHANQSSVSLPWRIYTLRCSSSWQDFVSSHLRENFLHISVVVSISPDEKWKSTSVPILLHVKSG